MSVLSQSAGIALRLVMSLQIFFTCPMHIIYVCLVHPSVILWKVMYRFVGAEYEQINQFSIHIILITHLLTHSMVQDII
jgi:hypothetical protein